MMKEGLTKLEFKINKFYMLKVVIRLKLPSIIELYLKVSERNILLIIISPIMKLIKSPCEKENIDIVVLILWYIT